MAQLGSHPNVVLLLGCCTENGKTCFLYYRQEYDLWFILSEPYYLVLEYVSGGKLLSYLRSHRKDCINYELDLMCNNNTLNDNSHQYGRINASGGRHVCDHKNTIDTKMFSKPFLKPYDLISYAYQIAKGMEFISSHGVRITTKLSSSIFHFIILICR